MSFIFTPTQCQLTAFIVQGGKNLILQAKGLILPVPFHCEYLLDRFEHLFRFLLNFDFSRTNRKLLVGEILPYLHIRSILWQLRFIISSSCELSHVVVLLFQLLKHIRMLSKLALVILLCQTSAHAGK